MNTVHVKKLLPALGAAFLWAVVGFISLWVFKSDPELNSLGMAFVRVIVNLVFVVAMHSLFLKRPGLPWGNGSRKLWLWGFLGAATITSFFASVQSVGAGEATLLQGSQGILVALLAPKILGERAEVIAIVGAFLGIVGLLFLFGPNLGVNLDPGKGWGLFSGLTAGSAYLLLAKERGRHSPETIGFYWCVVSFLVICVLLALSGNQLPWRGSTLAALTAGGLIASVAQWLTTFAYEQAPAPYVSATNYLVPMFSFLLEFLVFKIDMSIHTAIATVLIFCSGFVLPLLGLSFRKGKQS